MGSPAIFKGRHLVIDNETYVPLLIQNGDKGELEKEGLELSLDR